MTPSERPIRFTDDEVRAVLRDAKTQHRLPVPIRDVNLPERVVSAGDGLWRVRYGTRPIHDEVEVRSPFGAPGDRLWVRECWDIVFTGGMSGAGVQSDQVDRSYAVNYRAVGERHLEFAGNVDADPYFDIADSGPPQGSWRPSIHMPRWASRLTLTVKRVWVERVQDISIEDMAWEGCPLSLDPGKHFDIDGGLWIEGERECKRQWGKHWDARHAKRGHPFDANPWVFACEFERSK